MKADNLRIPALFVTILAWAVVAMTLISAVSMTVWLISYTQFAESPIMVLIAGIVSLILYLVYPLSVILVMVWVYIAHDNMRKAGLSGLNYSAGWATFSFWIPFVNLIVPFRAMRELANRSAGEPEELSEAEVDSVTSWWGCWIGSAVVGLFLAYNVFITLLPGIWVTTPFWANQLLIILFNVLTAGSAFFLIKIVQQVTRNQGEGFNLASTFE